MNSRSTHPQVSSSAPAVTQQGPPRAEVTYLESMFAELRVRPRSLGSTLGANVGSALEALRVNRIRSLLTVLGIFIGVASVIAALTLTQGANANIEKQIASQGTTIFIEGGTANKGGVSQGSGSLGSLTAHDAQSLESVSHVAAVSPVITTVDEVVYGRQYANTQIEGVNTDYQAIQSLQMARGAWFSSTDDANGDRVAVLGDTTAHNLFDASRTNPIGQNIRIRDQLFRVVGVLAAQGSGSGQDDVIYIPFETAKVRLRNTTSIDQILVGVDRVDNVEQVAQVITGILRQNHRLSNSAPDDFQVSTSIQFLQQADQGNQVLLFLLIGIAAISLTVGGIGIMNIMLVSVTERTWEIGLRMSVGARRRDIRNQFLIEALMLCLTGGVIGLLIGLLIGWAIINGFGLPFVVTVTTLVLPFAVSAIIAVAFGLYPAVRASHLDPIVAIRADE